MTDAPALRAVGLTKRYGARTAVEGVELTVRPGEVVGFIGPNGAGKTTTLAMVLGLIHPTAGSVDLFGAGGPSRATLRRVGSVVETPAFYPYLTGEANLRALAKASELPETRVAAVLDRVGLGSRGKSKFKTYSLGMKGRLGLAAALLGDPDLLILDEPTNGFDPQGIHEVRILLRELAGQGKAVLLSSHLLTEVEQVIDRLAIIRQGKVVAQGTAAELLRTDPALTLRVADPAAAVSALTAAGFTATAQADGRVRVTTDRAEAVNRTLAEAGLFLSELRVDEARLESLFLDLTGAAPAAGSAA